MTISPTVSTEWLADNLDSVKILDGSFYLPAENRDAEAEYAAAHIPGAQRFNINVVCAPSDLPHMFPDPVSFADAVGAMGIGNDDMVVAYDGGKLTGACRVWWMFRAFGHDKVAVLDGGFNKWRAGGGAVEDNVAAPAKASFCADYREGMVRSVDHMLTLIGQGGESQIIDARSAGRFDGTAPEPRAGLRSGHMPGAHNLPYDQLLNQDGTLKAADQLRELFGGAGVNLDKPVVTSCGSGVSAAVLLLGLTVLGHSANTLYDGSWSEWGGRDDTPIVNLTPMQLRTYVDADQAAVAELWQRAGLMQNPLNDPVRDITFCIAGGHGEILVLEDAGIIVATVMVGQDGHRGWIHYLAVEPERQGEHLGLRIVRAAEDRLKEQGVPKVHLMVRGSNTEAVGFYQRQGYRVEPVTTMSRRLDGQALPVGHQMDDEPVMITYLEMTQRPSLPQIIPKARKYALLGAHEMTVGFYRYLYDAVGRPWYWTDRKRLSDQELAVIIEDDGVEIYVLYISGAPAGFYELDARQMPTVDLAYFGLMPDYIGLGLGPYLLVQAIDMMWQKEPDRVTVNTCTLDHPKALPLYQRMGFQPYDRQEVPAPWQDPDNILDFA